VDEHLDPSLAAHLRAVPFFDFDPSRIATRAYFLGEKHPDSLENWLRAEVVESFLQADDALVLPAGALDFLRDYDLVDRIRFPTNEPRKKEFRGERNKSCAICGRLAPAVTFKTEAHLLPACTGNRYLYAAHECDECNLASGKDTEDELGKMLGPHRAMHQIQTRKKPSTTHQIYDGGSSLGGQARGEPLNLSVVEGSPTITTSDIGNNTLRVEVQSAPFRPMSALRSLARAAWHLLPTELRAQHADVLEWVRGEAGTPQLRYLDAVIPGPGLRHTTFAVWTRRAPDDEHPRLVFALALGTLVMVVPLGPRLWDAIPCPPLPRSPYGQTQLRSMKVLSDDSKSVTFNYEVRYLSRSLRGIPAGAPARVEIQTDTTTIGVDTALEAIPLPQGATKGPVEYVLTGGDLWGELRVVGTPLQLREDGSIGGGQFTTFYGLPDVAAVPDPSVARSTYAFVEALVGGGILRVTLAGNRNLFAEVALPRTTDANLAAVREALGIT